MILFVGQASLCLDLSLAGDLRPGHTHLAAAQRFTPGGQALLAACAAARLGLPVALVAAVGHDEWSVRLKRFLNEFGLDTRFLVTIRDAPTSLDVGVDHPLGEKLAHTALAAPGAGLLLRREHLRQHSALLEKATVVVADGGLPLDTLAWLATTRRLNHAHRLLNLAPVRPVWREPGAREAVQRFGELLVSHRGLEDWLGKPLPRPQAIYDATAALSRELNTEVTVDLEGLGVMGRCHGELKHLPGHALEVATPAHLRPGLCAGLAAGHWLGLEPMDRLALALRLSALCAHNHGGPQDFPTLEELNQFQRFVG